MIVIEHTNENDRNEFMRLWMRALAQHPELQPETTE